MTTMVERVARAISASHYADKDPDVMWRHMVPDARAAIEAMQNPTTKMKLVLGESVGSCDIGHDAWARAIDAALSEHKD